MSDCQAETLLFATVILAAGLNGAAAVYNYQLILQSEVLRAGHAASGDWQSRHQMVETNNLGLFKKLHYWTSVYCTKKEIRAPGTAMLNGSKACIYIFFFVYSVWEFLSGLQT